jgi:hypothetical protein
MKKNKGYYVIVVLGALILLSLACETHTSPNSLRIVEINNNQPLEVDVADWAVIPDPEDPEDSISVFFVKDWTVPVEITYIEPGLGLPTYPTPYTARVTEYKVSFSKVRNNPTDIPWVLSAISGGTNMVIETDPEGRNTVSADIKVVPADWIYYHFADSIENQSPGIVNGAVLKATLIMSGYEELTQEPVTDTAYFTIDIGDYYDDPFHVGQ